MPHPSCAGYWRPGGDIRPYGCGERWRVQMGWQGVLRKNIVGDDVLIVPSNHAGTDRRRVRDAAPYGGDGHSFDIQGAAARGCNEYEILAAPLVDGSINTHQSRAAR